MTRAIEEYLESCPSAGQRYQLLCELGALRMRVINLRMAIVNALACTGLTAEETYEAFEGLQKALMVDNESYWTEKSKGKI